MMPPRGRKRGRRRRTSRATRERSIDLGRYREIVPDWSGFLETVSRPEPTVFRVLSARISKEELLSRLERQGFELREIPGLPAFYQVERGPRPISMTLEHWLGLIYVQQASTGIAAPALAPAAGEHVLDLCAAPGGKTTHMAELMGDDGCLVASEISEPRIRGLLGNVYRLGHTNVVVIAADGRDFPEESTFDRVLVDAPCSGEGTLRRRGGQPPNQSTSFLSYVTRVQGALLEKAVRVTRPGGTILYVTCTFAPEENEAVVSDALSTLPVDLEPLELPVPHAPGVTSFSGQSYDERVAGAARVYPHHFDSGGLFLAKLRRLDGDLPVPEDGWSAVPSRFPETAAAPSGDPTSSRDGGGTLEEPDLLRGIEEVRDRFRIERDLTGVQWTVRGGRAWMHTVDEWPVEAWTEGRWRPISIGLRAIEFDSRGRPRPTNDFLRWSGATGAMVDLSSADVRVLLGGGALETDIEQKGPIALGLSGEVIGRGAVTVQGLKSEVPKARAKDLLRILDASSVD